MQERRPEISFDAAFARLSRLTNWERGRPDRPYRFDLAGMEALCASLGHPERRLGSVVQVAGSKGKGTLCSILAGMSVAAGRRTACYLSPHVVEVFERVQWNGLCARPGELARHVARVADRIGPEQTWFEAFTAAALDFFAARRPELSVLEVGLGGRLDSTSVVPKHASAISAIELEHTQVLGHTLAEVAREKAGILREGVPCVTSARGEALAAIEDIARSRRAPLVVLGRDLRVESRARGRQGVRLRVDGPGFRTPELTVPLRSRAQVESFVLALALCHAVAPEVLDAVLSLDPAEWLPRALPPGRFEVLRQDPPLVIDGAHTDGSLASLARDLEQAFPGRRYALVVGIAVGKRWASGLGRLAALADRAWVVPFEGKPNEDPERIRRRLAECGVACEVARSVEEALGAALAPSSPGAVVVTGSLYVAGEALRLLR